MNIAKTSKKYLSKPAILSMIGVFAFGFLVTPLVMANRFDQQIEELRASNNEKQQVQTQLEIEADSLQATINALASQISSLEAQIRENRAKETDLQAQIVEAEAELARQRKLLGENIKAMYLEGNISTLEILASSNNISDYVDKQQYRERFEERKKATLDKVNALKIELGNQKVALEKLIADQQTTQGLLDSQRAEQNRLLSLNAAERTALDTQIKENNSKITELRRQQAAENARLFGNGLRSNIPDTSGYPWANVQPFPNAIVDPWGMYMRQCVSYTAWKVWKDGKHMPYWGGFGNANQWAVNARRAGIPVDNNPRVGDIAVSLAGFYGHVMYVEAVYDDGRILISQYNAAWDGKYSEAIISPGNLQFIHFP